MICKQLKITLVFLISCLWFYSPVFAADQSESRVFDLPIIELKDVVADWFRKSGFQVRFEPIERGGLEIYAEKEYEEWQILLWHHSSLATRINARCTIHGQSYNGRAEHLWKHISSYIEEPSGNAKFKSSYQTLPDSVLQQIDTLVCIYADSDGRDIQLSGFIIDDSGLIICTAHDLKPLQTITVVLHDRKEVTGRVIKIDHHMDLTLIDVGVKLEKAVPLTKGRNMLQMGERIYAAVCPLVLSKTFYPGIIDGPPRRVEDQILWQVNMPVYHGSSGSPVFDDNGSLVGIVKGKYRHTENIGFVIPFETLMTFLNDGY
ncbi:MAG: serine protease [Desulfobacterales bacterium]|jgi:serine protease Do